MDTVSLRDDGCDEEDGAMACNFGDAVVVYICYLGIGVVIKKEDLMSFENVDVIIAKLLNLNSNA